MIKRNIKKIVLVLTFVVSVPLSFASCGEKQKEIKLTNDVRQDIKNEEKNSSKLEKIKELDFGNSMYCPICWKDDENIIVTEGSEKNKNIIDFKSIHVDDINIYDINVKTSKISKINTITDAVCGDLGQKGMYGNFLYIKDNKLCMYNALQNTQKSIYDLTEIMNKQKENSKILGGDKELLKRIHAGFVFGSSKYVYIMTWLRIDKCDVRVIDLQTGNVITDSFDSRYFPGLDTVRYNCSWVYNKNKDVFYITLPMDDFMYECKLGSSNDLKRIENVGGEIFDISEDGNDIYLSGIYKKGKRSIIEYNVAKNKVTEITSIKADDKNRVSVLENVAANYVSNVISYSVQNFIVESDNKTISKIQATSFIGDFDGKEIKSSRMLPIEQLDNKNNGNTIMLNEKGNTFIYSVIYFDYDSKNDITKLYKVRNYLYEIKK